MNYRKGFVLIAAVLAMGFVAPAALARCASSVQSGPIPLCKPNTEPPGQGNSSDQTPPNIPCWKGVSCGGGGGGGGGGTSPPTISSFSATPNPVAYNSSATLSWTSANTGACTLSSMGAVAQNGSKSTAKLTSARSYTLTCYGVGSYSGNSDSKAVTVSVKAAQAPTLSLSPSHSTFRETKRCRMTGMSWSCTYTAISPNMGNFTMAWSATPTSGSFTGTCQVTKNGIGQSAPGVSSGGNGSFNANAPDPQSGNGFSRTMPGTPTRDTWKLSCTGPYGTVSKTATVTTYGLRMDMP